LINLQNGGIAQGSYSGAGQPRAKIINASLLPDSGRGLNAIRINAGAHFGTGMLVSFLQNAASYLFRELGLSLFVGDMSVRNGGRFGQSHQTHKNGLDADIAYLAIKNPLRDSALASNGRVVPGFNFEATWTFLQLAAKQEFISEAKKVSSISRVFMSHRVKDGFCAWAKEKDLLDDPFNRELMRLVRREKGHHKHFHLSMKCSPHYPTCRNLAGPPPEGPGCP
jgi:penicillin-insensitive murein DD-endopeptidase